MATRISATTRSAPDNRRQSPRFRLHPSVSSRTSSRASSISISRSSATTIPLAVHAYETWGFTSLSKEMIEVLNGWARFVYCAAARQPQAQDPGARGQRRQRPRRRREGPRRHPPPRRRQAARANSSSWTARRSASARCSSTSRPRSTGATSSTSSSPISTSRCWSGRQREGAQGNGRAAALAASLV